MRRGLLVWLGLVLLSACGSGVQQEVAQDTPSAAVENQAEQFGEPLTLGEATPIADVLDRPDEFVGKRVAVRGRVAEVCPNMGCWVDLQEGDRRLRVKVEDGVIVFPKTLAGKTATAEGTIERLEMSREEYEAYLRHEAEEKGVEFDPALIGDPPYSVIRLRGLGAQVDPQG